eukprot:2459136-Rhodomonas_salina.1
MSGTKLAYEMSGTEIAYGATSDEWRALDSRRASLCPYAPICMSGTDIAYCAIPPARPLRNVRY